MLVSCGTGGSAGSSLAQRWTELQCYQQCSNTALCLIENTVTCDQAAPGIFSASEPSSAQRTP